jgi:Family of unknown function (DUF6325)
VTGDDLRRVSAHDRTVQSSEYEPREDEIGPVDFLAVEFPGGRISAADLRELMALVTQGTIRILDAEFIVKDAAGNARKADAAELGEPDGTGIGAWSGASSGLLDDADVEHVSAAIGPGAAAAVIVYENRWILRLADSWRRSGARLIEDGGIPVGDLVAALDAAERS